MSRTVSVVLVLAFSVGLFVWFSVDLGGPGSGSPDPIETVVRERLATALEDERFPADPWVIAHGLLALDPEDRIRRHEWARLLDRWETDGTFPLHTADGRGEQHPHLVLKVLAEIGTETEDPWFVDRARSLATGALATASWPEGYREWNDLAWFLHAMATLAGREGDGPGATTPLGTGGRTLGELAEAALARVEEIDRVVETALAEPGPFSRPSGDAPPEIAGVYAYTCGGQHLLQAVLAAAGAGLVPEEDLPRVEARVALLIRRLDAEEEFRRRESERALAAGVSAPRVARQRVRATLKLHGHALETLALAHPLLPASRPTIEAALEREVQRVVELLRTREEELDPDGTIAPRWRTEDPLLWELWFGDGCHALHGLARVRALRAE